MHRLPHTVGPIRPLAVAWIGLLALAASAQEPSAPLRLTAVIRRGADVRAGVVTAEGVSRLARPGESVGGWTVEGIDFERGWVTLRRDAIETRIQFDGRTADLDLPMPPARVDTNFYSAAALQQFFAEFPDLERFGGRARIALKAPPVEPGHGEAIDRAIRDQPGVGVVVDMVVTGQGPAIEGYLGTHPEASNAPDTTASGYGPEIERRLGGPP